MEIRAVNAYHGICPCCHATQTSLNSNEVDVLCSFCKYITDEMREVFCIPRDAIDASFVRTEGYLHTFVNKINCVNPDTKDEYEMILPQGLKKIRI